jgi:DNA-binding NtrC family response regulator
VSRRPPRAAEIDTSTDRARIWRTAVDRLVDELASLEERQATFHAAARQFVQILSGAPPAPSGPVAGLDLPSLLCAYERALVLWALAKAAGRQFDAARLLRIRPTTLNEKMKRLGIARSNDGTASPRASADILRLRRTTG